MTERDERLNPELDAALDDCCRRVARGEPLERCLPDYPAAYRAELMRLVPVSQRVAALVRDPAPEFTARLQERLAQAIEAERGTASGRIASPGDTTIIPGSSTGDRGRVSNLIPRLRRALTTHAARAAAVAAVCIILLGAGGAAVVSAADASLPDSPLYRVKETQESAELWLARDDQARMGLYARQVRRRAVELARAVRAEKPEPIINALSLRLAASVDQMVDASLRLRAQGTPRPAIRTRALIGEMRSRLGQIMTDTAPTAQAPLHRLDAHLDQQEQRLPPRPRRAIRRGT